MMNLNIDYLLQSLSENENEILEKIHNDPMLSKRQCPETGLFIANASKGLFTPEHEWQLYAKGIIYERDSFGSSYKLIALGYLKIYNFDENQMAKAHVNEMINLGAEPVYLNKLDGAFIGRFVYNDKVYIYTRGMIETMAENDEQRQYFKWAREIIKEKYPKVDDPEYLNTGTSLFELIGPGNQIVTHYPEWDLVMTGFVMHNNKKNEFEDFLAEKIRDHFNWEGYKYYSHEELVGYCGDYNYAKPVTKLYAFGETIEEQIQSINQLFSSTDDEGSVIQFEVGDPDLPGRMKVIGRIKAKTDTYRKLLKLMNGCNYETISSLIKSDIERFKYWDNFKNYLMSLGSANYPEELMDSYSSFFEEFWRRDMYSKELLKSFENTVANILDWENIKFSFDENMNYVLDKHSRAKFAAQAQTLKYTKALFAVLDGKLTSEEIRDKMFEGEKLNEAVKVFGLGVVK